MAKRSVVGSVPEVDEELNWLRPSSKPSTPTKMRATTKPRKLQKSAKPLQISAKPTSSKSEVRDVHISYWFPVRLINKLKQTAKENNMSLSGYISHELVKKSKKNIDIHSIKKIYVKDKKVHLSIMLPKQVIKGLKLEAIEKDMTFTDLLMGKLH